MDSLTTIAKDTVSTATRIIDTVAPAIKDTVTPIISSNVKDGITSEVIGGIILSVITIIGGYLIYIMNKPRLEIKFHYDGISYFSKGISHTYDGYKQMLPAPKIPHDFEVRWDLYFKISNKSKHTAYSPDVKVENVSGKIERFDKINSYEIIDANKVIPEFMCFITNYKTMSSDEQIKNTIEPEELKNLKITITYKNESGKKLYCVYNHNRKCSKVYYFIPNVI